MSVRALGCLALGIAFLVLGCSRCEDLPEECVPDETLLSSTLKALRHRSLPWAGTSAWAEEWDELSQRWGSPGWITQGFGLGADGVLRAAVWQPDHKLLVAGRIHNGSFNDFAIARFWPDGSPDSSFGTNGLVQTTFAHGEAIAHAVAYDTTGRIIVAGRRWGYMDYDFGVSRYLSNGTEDATFGSGGHVLVDINRHDFARAVGVDSLGRINVVGYSNNGTLGQYDFAIARLTSTGALDTNFSTDGKATANFFGNWDTAYAMLIDTTDRVIAVGRAINAAGNNDFAAARWATNGNLDATFSGDGLHNVDSPGTAPANVDDLAWGACFDDAGRLWMGGRVDRAGTYEAAFVRLTTGGATNGNISFAVGSGALARGMALAADARLLFGGRAWDGSDWNFLAGRFDSAGALDGNFDTDGVNTAAITGNNDVGYALAYHQGKLVVVGTSRNTDLEFAIARFNSNGARASSASFDAHFNTNGYTSTDFNADIDQANAIAVDGRGRLILGGFRENGGAATRDFALVRYTTNGVPDTGFSGDGLQNSNFTGDDDEIYGVAVDSSDRVYAAGFRESSNAASRDFAVARYLSNGNLDTTFSTDGLQNTDFLTDQDEAYGIAVDSLSRPVLVGIRETAGGGAATRRWAIARYATDGALDTTFQTTGVRTIDFSNDRCEAFAVAIDTLGRIVAVGTRENGGIATRNFALARMTTDGTLDSANFGTNGLQTTDFGGNRRDEANYLAFDTNGKLVVVGMHSTVGSSFDFAIARYNTNGVLDSSFSGDGLMTVDNAGGDDQAKGIALQKNGKMVISGTSGTDIMLVRLHTDGSLDTSFGASGIKILNPVAATDSAGKGLVMMGDDRVAGPSSSNSNFLVYRLWP